MAQQERCRPFHRRGAAVEGEYFDHLAQAAERFQLVVILAGADMQLASWVLPRPIRILASQDPLWVRERPKASDGRNRLAQKIAAREVAEGFAFRRQKRGDRIRCELCPPCLHWSPCVNCGSCPSSEQSRVEGGPMQVPAWGHPALRAEISVRAKEKADPFCPCSWAGPGCFIYNEPFRVRGFS